MALIRIFGEGADSLEQRLCDLLPDHRICCQDPAADDGLEEEAVLICAHRQWRSACGPPPGRRPVLLLSRREPADPAAAFMAGFDAWLPLDCPDGQLAAQIAVLLDAGATHQDESDSPAQA